MREKLKRFGKVNCLLTLVSVVLGHGTFAIAAPGGVDPGFGFSGGAVTYNLPAGGSFFVNRIALQPSGKFLIGGVGAFGQTVRLYLRRHKDWGQLDTTFGYNGEAVEQQSNGSYRYIYVNNPTPIAVQPDGKFLIGGNRLSISGAVLGLSVWRFTENGLLDTTFDGDGRIDLALPVQSLTAANATVERIAFTSVRTNGTDSPRLLVVATFNNTVDYGIEFGTVATTSTLYRFGQNGGADASFGQAGKVQVQGEVVDLATWSPQFSLAGESIYLAGIDVDMTATAWRFEANGTLDSTFGSGGKAKIPNEIFAAQRFDRIAVQPDGRLLLSGDMNPTQGILVTYIYQADVSGNFQVTFGDTIFNGFGAIKEFGLNEDVALQSDGKFIVGKFPETKRYFPDGTRDSSYVVPLASGEYQNFVLQSDNKLVAIEPNFESSAGGYASYTLRRLLP